MSTAVFARPSVDSHPADSALRALSGEYYMLSQTQLTGVEISKELQGSGHPDIDRCKEALEALRATLNHLNHFIKRRDRDSRLAQEYKVWCICRVNLMGRIELAAASQTVLGRSRGCSAHGWAACKGKRGRGRSFSEAWKAYPLSSVQRCPLRDWEAGVGLGDTATGRCAGQCFLVFRTWL